MWLREHLYNFILPGIWLLKQKPHAGIDATEINKVKIDAKFRPAKKAWCEEAGIVHAALSSWGLKQHSWLFEQEEHAIQAFLSFKDSHPVDTEPGYTKQDLLHSIIKNSWKALKRRSWGKTVVLPGRDVWLWWVMAQRYPGPEVVFDPTISRNTAMDKELLKRRMLTWGVTDWPKTIIYDTGFAGSIWRAMCKAIEQKPENVMLSTTLTERTKAGREISCQIFPNHKGSRNKALAIEYLPKYWRSGHVRYKLPEVVGEYGRSEMYQWLSELDEFLRAAVMTIWFWNHQSPRFVKRDVPKKYSYSYTLNTASNSTSWALIK
jgi:hypothetical protein